MAQTSSRFTVTPLFEGFLETMSIEYDADVEALVLVCTECGDSLCEVEADDTLRVLVNTAVVHDDGDCEARNEQQAEQEERDA